jgi:hypothetical protein
VEAICQGLSGGSITRCNYARGRYRRIFMKKLLLRWFMPSAEQITDLAVKVVSEFVNSSDKTELIAKYGSYADQITKVQSKITGWLKDGKIDEQEKAELTRALLPLAEKLVKEVTK